MKTLRGKWYLPTPPAKLREKEISTSCSTYTVKPAEVGGYKAPPEVVNRVEITYYARADHPYIPAGALVSTSMPVSPGSVFVREDLYKVRSIAHIPLNRTESELLDRQLVGRYKIVLEPVAQNPSQPTAVHLQIELPDRLPL